jgi:lactate dehydrogenase-like 2-hydroxyacid dehydrogenase
MVRAAFLAAMPDGALVVNAARGVVVDTDALVAELEAGRLRAALDVHRTSGERCRRPTPGRARAGGQPARVLAREPLQNVVADY